MRIIVNSYAPDGARNLINLIILACTTLIPTYSVINYYHSFRSFRAQSLNLMNVAVYVLEMNPIRCV